MTPKRRALDLSVSMKLNGNFLGGGGAKQKPSMRGVWIFSGTAQYAM